ncbi:Immunity protein 52 [Paraburkholderia tropica]|uniref:immunity 52 family protein n=1 Tax=Paraburkholderia tropica TaxID=92647 RepID=UPI001CAD73A2|nr:immunity 52 family protein [Paraburkholderia tropica]CAG9234413.1 Immunity protein 52 [Paraburkholderia tropica]
MYLQASFRDSTSVREGDFLYQLRRVYPILSELSVSDKTLGGPWYLSGDGEDDRLGVPVFEGAEPRAAAIEELNHRSRHESGQPKSIDIWNGISGRGNASTINIIIDCGSIANQFELSVSERRKGASRAGSYVSSANVVSKVAIEFDCPYVIFGPRPYFEKQVFADRPGVSWMLYLPHALTSAQVPEARALIPVMRDCQQQGTIIVSVTDEVFDVNNRAHVKVANDIEIRLADQDLLPRYVDL